MKDRRRGIFRIAQGNIDRKPEVMRQIMGRCTILRAESLLMLDAIEYHAISPDFREVELGQVIPEYEWVVDEATGTVRAQEIVK